MKSGEPLGIANFDDNRGGDDKGKLKVHYENAVFSGNIFDRNGFSIGNGCNTDNAIMKGVTISANKFIDCGISIMNGDGYIYEAYSFPFNDRDKIACAGSIEGFEKGNMAYPDHNLLENVTIAGNDFYYERLDNENETTHYIIRIHGGVIGGNNNTIDGVKIRNNKSRIADSV
jgi:hypothetical protein